MAPPPPTFAPLPVWVRAPASGTRCPYTALSRGGFFLVLRLAGRKIRTVALCETGAKGKAGSRHVNLADLCAWMAERAEQQAAAAEQEAAAAKETGT